MYKKIATKDELKEKASNQPTSNTSHHRWTIHERYRIEKLNDIFGI